MADIMWHKGRTMRVVHQDELTREEKDILRKEAEVVQHGKLFLKEIAEEPEVEGWDDQDPEGVVDSTTGSEAPTLEELNDLTVAQLKELADEEGADVQGLKVKADLVGRLAAHFGLEL